MKGPLGWTLCLMYTFVELMKQFVIVSNYRNTKLMESEPLPSLLWSYDYSVFHTY